MRLPNLTKSNLQPFIPENPSTCKTIQDSFMEEKYSDIAFEVGGEKGKATEATSVTFPAHRIIVAKFSNTLADLCASGAGDNVTTRIPIEIDNVSPDIFRLLLSYIYGMTISNDNMKLHAKEIIDAADRFGVTSLKLEAEASLVNNTAFDIKNVKELLLYADSKNCALLKEATMDYILENNENMFDSMMLLVRWLVMYWQPLHVSRSERTVQELPKLSKTVRVVSIPCGLVSYGEWYTTKV